MMSEELYSSRGQQKICRASRVFGALREVVANRCPEAECEALQLMNVKNNNKKDVCMYEQRGVGDSKCTGNVLQLRLLLPMLDAVFSRTAIAHFGRVHCKTRGPNADNARTAEGHNCKTRGPTADNAQTAEGHNC